MMLDIKSISPTYYVIDETYMNGTSISSEQYPIACIKKST